MKKEIIITFAITCVTVLCICWFKFGKDNSDLHTANLSQEASLGKEVDSKEAISSDLSHDSDSSNQNEGLEDIKIYVCGAVKNPGVYELSDGSRVSDAVDMAGGFLKSAAKNYYNLAEYVKDAQKIYIITKKKLKKEKKKEKELIGDHKTSENSSGKVNINTAAKEELMTLPGVGEKKAQDIINYRTENGQFSSLEDIMNISGIKEGVFGSIKDMITI